MGLSKLSKRVDTILGIDVSTNSFAWCLFANGQPVRWGEVQFKGKNVFERLSDGQNKVRGIKDTIKADKVVFESAVYVQNKKTVIMMAYAFGAIIAAILDSGSTVDEITPMEWQNAIGNKALTKVEKEAIKQATPGKSENWYKAEYRNVRKARTIKWVKDTYDINVESDNVSDAIAIASVSWGKYGKQTI